MKIRRPLPLLLLLASPCLVLADSEKPTNDEILALNRARPREQIQAAHAKAQANQIAKEAVLDGTKKANGVQSTRPYVGTEDAPVDGLDGKPHAGPFVDTTPEQSAVQKGAAAASATAKSVPTSLEKLAGSADIPEKNDGVMNDDARPVPRKGTTGTEGGVTEKEKAKKAKGGDVENKPKSPTEAPPLPHSEQERMEGEDGGSDSKTKQLKAKDGKEGEKSGKQVDTPKKGGEYGAGGMGMEKPTDLPDKPHNIPHPEPRIATQANTNREGPPVGSKSSGTVLHDTLPYTEGTKPKAAAAPGSPEAHDESFEEWFHSFVVSFTMIIFTEIGDKTFLVAALMAMRHPRLIVFTAAFSALIVMTVLSAVAGHLAPTLLPKRLTTFAAALLFLIFGARMLREGLDMPKEAGVGEEMKEVEAELEEKEHHLARRNSRRESNPYVLEAGRGKGSPSPSRSPSKQSPASGLTNLMSLVLSPVWVQTFVMTFLGEWGDRSQIATVAMAAGQDYWWVTAGAVVGHCCCTGLAVVGGRALAGRVSMRVGESISIQSHRKDHANEGLQSPSAAPLPSSASVSFTSGKLGWRLERIGHPWSYINILTNVIFTIRKARKELEGV